MQLLATQVANDILGIDCVFKQLAGDHTQTETPVPIPNTAVKRLGPMVVRPARE
jgi:hypothetical protein